MQEARSGDGCDRLVTRALPNGNPELPGRWDADLDMKQRGLGAHAPLPDYDDGRLSVRPADYMVLADGAIVPLKLRELGLLAALANQPDRVITRDELLESVWGRDDAIASRAVDACVARLRSALADALPDRRYIHTHARIGYRFSPEVLGVD